MDKNYLKNNLSELVDNIKIVCKNTGRDFNNITLVAVSKTFPEDDISYLNDIGHLDFGENKVQELISKYENLKHKNIKWHLIGHLQTNKVKYVSEFVHLIHSVDSFKLAEVINDQAMKHNRIIDVLIQVNTSNEEQKSGINPEDTKNLCEEIAKLNNIRIKGLMTIGMFTEDEDIIRANFKCLKSIYDELKFVHTSFEYLSMGMTSDYKIAIEEGSNMLRIGSAIFGYRNYLN